MVLNRGTTRRVRKEGRKEEVRRRAFKTQGKIDLRNESGRPMKVKVVGGVSEK